ncbi:hypothetical protein L3i22_060940 [Actinoplanes sp. L3-i22]|nr:hypothetical protein L3i22_060940 [Actinoplanes sp. L3-i22]
MTLRNPTGPRPRPADAARSGGPEFVAVEPGWWAVCVFGLLTKLGFEHLDFPHYWGRRGDGTAWRVARHGDVPDGTFIFTSWQEARDTVTQVYGDVQNLRPLMGWIEIPSQSQRMRAADRRAPRSRRPGDIYASRSDLALSRRMSPDSFAEYVAVETALGDSFQQDKPLALVEAAPGPGSFDVHWLTCPQCGVPVLASTREPHRACPAHAARGAWNLPRPRRAGNRRCVQAKALFET